MLYPSDTTYLEWVVGIVPLHILYIYTAHDGGIYSSYYIIANRLFRVML